MEASKCKQQLKQQLELTIIAGMLAVSFAISYVAFGPVVFRPNHWNKTSVRPVEMMYVSLNTTKYVRCLWSRRSR